MFNAIFSVFIYMVIAINAITDLVLITAGWVVKVVHYVSGCYINCVEWAGYNNLPADGSQQLELFENGSSKRS